MDTRKISLYLYLSIITATILSTIIFQFQLNMVISQKNIIAALPLIIVGALLGLSIAKIVINQDEINDLKKTSKQKEEELNTYVAGVVHDLRSPLASINMITELLEEELDSIEPYQTELLDSIRVSSVAMLDKVSCIIDQSKMELNGGEMNLVEENPQQVISYAIEKHKVLAYDKNIKLDNQLPSNIPDCYFDKESLDSVVSNLVSNAIKYSNANTTVTITGLREQGQFAIQVTDQGLGMSKDDLDKVFGKFTKLSARPTGGEASSGLGLSLVKKQIENMGGTVTASSEGKGKGSTFTFTLKTATKVARMSMSA